MLGPTSSSTFFCSQRTGRWRWPWLLLSIFVAVVTAVAGIVIFAAAVAGLGDAGVQWAVDASANLDGEALATDPMLLAVDLLLVGLPLWGGAIAASLVHGRSARSLVEPLRRFRWTIVRKVLAFELAALFFLWLLPTLLPGTEEVNFTGFEAAHLTWLVPLLLFTLVQTSGEDVFFKGYLLRQFGAATRIFWLAPVLVVAAFVAVHIGNPDIQETQWLLFPLFAVSELIIVYLMMRTGGMEVPLVLHWTNNSIIFFLVAERETQANDLTLFVFDNDPTTLTDDLLSNGLFPAIYLGLQLVAFTWKKSPLHLEPHGWTPPPVSHELDQRDRALDAQPPPPGSQS